MQFAQFYGLVAVSILTITWGDKTLAKRPRFGYPYYDTYENYTRELYNPLKEKCCRGTANPITMPGTKDFLVRCCDTTTYDVTENICCNGEVLPLSAGTKTACCGDKTYDVKEAICCANKVSLLPSEAKPEDLIYFDCCGSKSFDKRTQACCAGVVVKSACESAECCGDKSYDPTNQVCCYDSVFPKETGCCGGKPFDASTKMCCDGEITDSPEPNRECCKGEGYDADTHLCCVEDDGTSTVVLKTNNYTTGCCGSTSYDPESSICCNGTVFNIPPGLYHWQYSCCGDWAYDSSEAICCNEDLIPTLSGAKGCCDDEPYNYETQLCCQFDGNYTVYNKTSSDDSCCRGTNYSTSTHICCTSYMVWDEEIQSYFSEKIHEIQDSETKCCELEAYNVKDKICCESELLSKNGEDDRRQCCGTKLYEPDRQQCCDTIIIDIEDNERDTCCSAQQTDEGDYCPVNFYQPPYNSYSSDSEEEESNEIESNTVAK